MAYSRNKSMIKSIFGLTTEDIREEQLKQQQQLAAQLQKQGTSPFAATIGTALGAGIGRGLMERFGFQSPEMEKAQQVEAMQSELDAELAKLDPSDPARNYIIGQALVRAGQPEEAARYFALGRQADALASQQLTSKQELELRERQLEVAEAAERRKQFESDAIFGMPNASPTTVPTQAQQVVGQEATTPEPTNTMPKLEEMKIGEMIGSEDNRIIKVGENDFRPVSEFTEEELKALRAMQASKVVPNLANKLGSSIYNFILDPENTRGQ